MDALFHALGVRMDGVFFWDGVLIRFLAGLWVGDGFVYGQDVSSLDCGLFL